MSLYQFRKPTIIQQAGIISAAMRGDMETVAHLLDEVTVDDILNLPFTELGAIAKGYAEAMQAWSEEQDALPDGVADYLAGLVGEEDG